jgi:DNA-directed RNA polymerase specialized sigma24 family protein
MTTLDHRLYAWLLEPDEQRFELAFNAYFSVAYPAVMRRMARLSRWDASQLEELAQDVLLKFFERVGRGRREASANVERALAVIRPLEMGPHHERQVNEWTSDASTYRAAAMGFRLPPLPHAGDAEWKVAIRSLSARIPPLQTRGWHLIDAVRLRIQCHLDDEGPAGAQRLATEVIAKTVLGLAVERHLPGAVQFIECTFIVIGAIPRLQIPTNAYLFEIADTLYLDECRKRGRQKRGGRGVSHGRTSATHPLELFALESDSNGDGDEFVNVDGDEFALIPVNTHYSATVDVPASDPARHYEGEEFLEKFCDYLRAPVDEATEAYDKARARGRAVTERQKLDSLNNKYSRAILVLSMLGEGYSQEQTAERLGLSRNQVKYTVELVQEAYTRFAACPVELQAASSALGV